MGINTYPQINPVDPRARSLEEALAELGEKFDRLRIDDRRRPDLARRIRILQDELDARGGL